MTELAIDFGSSFCAAAVSADGPVLAVQFGPTRSTRMPSMCWLGIDGTIVVGDAASLRVPSTDGVTLKNLKSLVGRELPIAVGQNAVDPLDVITEVFAEIGREAKTVFVNSPTAAQPWDAVVLTCPATWASPRRKFLTEAAHRAFGVPVGTVSDARAASAELLAHQNVTTPEDMDRVLVYDLGGSSLDVTVLEQHPPERGGRQVLWTQLGAGSSNAAGGDLFDALTLRWLSVRDPTIEPLLQPDFGGLLQQRLALDAAITRAREALSTQRTALVDLPEIGIQTRVYREELEELLDEAIKDTVAMTMRMLARAEVKPADVSLVLLAGGASRTPKVSAALWDAFSLQPATTEDPKIAIVHGAMTLLSQGSIDLVDAPPAPTTHAKPSVENAAITLAVDDHPSPPESDSRISAPRRQSNGSPTLEQVNSPLPKPSNPENDAQPPDEHIASTPPRSRSRIRQAVAGVCSLAIVGAIITALVLVSARSGGQTTSTGQTASDTSGPSTSVGQTGNDTSVPSTSVGQTGRDTSGATTSGWIDQANNYCRTVADPAAKSIGRPNTTSDEPRWLRAISQINLRVLAYISGLAIPADQTKDASSMIYYWQVYSDQFQSAATQYEAGDIAKGQLTATAADTNNQRGNVIANSLGLTDCAAWGTL